MKILTLVLALAAAQGSGVVPSARGAAEGAVVLAVFDQAPDWSRFFAGVRQQRQRWRATAARATVPPALAGRMKQASADLRLLLVAQDWCLDSANIAPYVARLASSADVPVRVADRTSGKAVMNLYRTRDGRTVTPLVVLIRGDRVVAAWVERPAPLQHDFETMATDPEARGRFENRQAWYDADAGRTTMTEIVELAERTASGRSLPAK
jgi:thioredoxin family protein